MHFQADPILARITSAIPSVGRLDFPKNPRMPYGGTAFVVGPGLLMTNRHVAELFTMGVGTRFLSFRSSWDPGVDFKREDEADSAVLVAIRGVRMIHPYWDMALVEVDGLTDAHRPIRLSLLEPEALRNREVAVIGYPAFDPRNDAAVQNQVFEGVYDVKRLQPGNANERLTVESFGKKVSALSHDSSTLGGNSGSIVLDVQTGHAVALHFGGIYLKSNFGVPSAELGRDGRVIDAGVQFAGTPQRKTTSWDSYWQKADADERVRPGEGAKVRAGTSNNGEAVWCVPLEIRVSVGDVTRVTETVTRGETAEVITEKMVEPYHDGDLSDRPGYDTEFLGVKVPLPKLKDEDLAAPVTGGGHVLKYHHFSLVMHRRRRIAMYTASNIDTDEAVRRPEPGKDYSRKGLSGLGPNDQEKWFVDPRISAGHQLPDRFFTKDDGAFDKGHIVRREDVAWGDSYAQIRAANGDTFHTTNCSPQVAGFNRSNLGDENWGELENYVLAQAKSEKLSLFAGPVLSKDDPIFVGKDDDGAVRIQIPGRYWKTVLAVSDGKLQSYGFVLEQDLSDTPLEFAVDAVWQRHMIPIAELENLLHIQFSKAVRDADQFGTENGEGVRSSTGIRPRPKR